MFKRILLFTLAILTAAAARADEFAFLQEGHEHAITVIEDVTDPSKPVEIWRGDNIVGQCGIRDLMAQMTGKTTMGAATGAADTLGQRCQGTMEVSGTQKVPCVFDGTSRIAIGAASAGTCTSSTVPWACCTGAGTGCAVNGLDVITFTEGQPNGTLVGVRANYSNWVGFGSPNLTMLPVDSTPALNWDGSTTMGLVVVATADANTANQQWCEYAVRTASGSASNACLNCCGAFASSTAGNPSPGWQLNHQVINPCLSKSTGQIYRITITITAT